MTIGFEIFVLDGDDSIREQHSVPSIEVLQRLVGDLAEDLPSDWSLLIARRGDDDDEEDVCPECGEHGPGYHNVEECKSCSPEKKDDE